jgi:hypothetical protein
MSQATRHDPQFPRHPRKHPRHRPRVEKRQATRHAAQLPRHAHQLPRPWPWVAIGQATRHGHQHPRHPPQHPRHLPCGRIERNSPGMRSSTPGMCDTVEALTPPLASDNVPQASAQAPPARIVSPNEPSDEASATIHNRVASDDHAPRLPAQRPGVQPPRARSKKQHQKLNDLAREAIGLQRHVSLHLASVSLECHSRFCKSKWYIVHPRILGVKHSNRASCHKPKT